jgi:hypothetical protein
MTTMNIYDMADTWNAGGTTFTAIKMNVTDTASAAGSLLLDLQVGGTSQFKVSKGGRVTAQTLTIGLGGQTVVATNTALGFEALHSASLTGTNNVGVGYRALLSNTTGGNISAVGMNALYSNTTGSDSVAVGTNALFSNTTGSDSVAIGTGALYFNTTVNQMTAVGVAAFNKNTTGDQGVAVGYLAGRDQTTATRSTLVGHSAGSKITTGAANTIFGAQSGINITTSEQNVAFGSYTLNGAAGNNNVAVGNGALNVTTGANNIALGFNAGNALSSGGSNIVIGASIELDSNTASNQINIGGRYFHDRIRLLERTSDPAKPAEGNVVIWMSDGTGLGDDGDIMIGSTAGGVTNYGTLFDHSGGTLWP